MKVALVVPTDVAVNTPVLVTDHVKLGWLADAPEVNPAELTSLQSRCSPLAFE